MKKLFKKLSVVMLLAASLCSLSKAAPIAITYTTTNNFGYLTTGVGELKSITVYNPSTSNAVVQVYDSPTNVLAYTNAQYTNFTVSTITFTNIYTNIFGVITTNTYNTETNTSQTVSPTASSYRIIAIVSVPASNNVTFTPPAPGYVFVNGLFTTNVGASGASNLVIVADVAKRQ